jgi:integrase
MRNSLLDESELHSVKVGDGRRSDGGGLYLKPARSDRESHAWRFDYSFESRRQTLSLGTYPAVSLQEAREAVGRCRQLLAAGVNPSSERKAKRAAGNAHKEAPAPGGPILGSFEEVARRWFSSKQEEWMETYSSKLLRRFELHVFPHIGGMKLGDVQVSHVLQICRRVQQAGSVETGLRVRELCSWVFQFAIAEDLTSSDPCRDIRRALKTPEEKHFPALIKPAELATYLRAADSYTGSVVVRSALQLAPMLMVRPGELRLAEWKEFDLDRGLWVIPSIRLKRRKREKLFGKPHLVHLPRQAVIILETLFKLTARTAYVFAGTSRGACISNSTVNAALRRMGYCTKTEVTGHGFRATFRTLTVELLGFPEAIVEMQLAHAVKDQNGTAYNRTEFLEQRRVLMQDWADYLEDLKCDRAVPTHPLLTEFTPVTTRLIENMETVRA